MSTRTTHPAAGPGTDPSIREFDWSGTPLGPRDAWPAALTSIHEMMMASPFAMCAGWGPELTLIYNDAYVDFLAGRHPDALGRPISEVWHDVWTDIRPLIERAMAGELVHHTDMHLVMTRKGYAEDTYWTFAYSALRNGGTVAGFLDIATETTAGVLAGQRRDAAEASLRDLNATLERQVAERTADRNALWYLSSDIMLRCTFDGVMTAVNPAWTQLLGWREDELVGSGLFTLIHPDDLDRTIAGARELAEGTSHARFDNRYRHRDGSYRWISWSTKPADGLINAVGRDVTAEKEQAEALAQAEDALRQSQKMEAVGQLTGGVAHDFNNLLTVIKSSTDLLKRPDLAPDRRTRYVGAISDTVDRAAKLTGQLLAFARRQALKPEVFAACDSVRALSDMMGTLTGSRIDIVTDLPEQTCFVHADPSQFDTALVNMAVNARDAMDGEGRLVIRVRAIEAMPAIRSHAIVLGAFVAISISDTGSGIPAERLERIFEPFFTTKGVGQGTGLGLSQVFGFAKQSGGEVAVESEVGVGTTFTLYLPRVAGVEGARGAGEPEPLFDGHGTCVLVVEDNVEVGTFAVQTLTDLGYVVVLATDAEAALAELGRDADRFDVVFSDVVMPGMNGIDLAHRIRDEHHDLPVLLASGYSHVLAQNGTYGFELLHKPYSVEQLSRLLRKVATWQRRKRIMGK